MNSDEPAARSHCRGCGAHVTPRFARVFGGRNDTVSACLTCAGEEALLNGAAAGHSGGDGR